MRPLQADRKLFNLNQEQYKPMVYLWNGNGPVFGLFKVSTDEVLTYIMKCFQNSLVLPQRKCFPSILQKYIFYLSSIFGVAGSLGVRALD